MSRDRVSALMAIAIGGGLLPFALKVQTKTVFSNPSDPGSRFFPVMACSILIIAGIGLFITSPKKQKAYFTKTQWRDLVIGFGTAVLYVVVMSYTGFLTATAAFLFVMCTLFLRKKKWAVWKRLLYAAVVSGAIYILFTNILGLRLPVGFLI